MMFLERGPFWLIVLTVLAILTTWLLRELEEDALPPPPSQMPDYTLTQFTAVRLTDTGTVRHRLEATSMQHFAVQNTKLSQPLLTLYNDDEPLWKIRAEHGEVSVDGNQVWLLGNTRVERQPMGSINADTPPVLTVLSRDVSIDLARQYAETAAPSTILHDQGKTDTIGMRIFLALNRLELLSQVRGIYEPDAH